MKLVTYIGADGLDKVGGLTASGDLIVDLSHIFPDMLALIDGGELALTQARAGIEKRASTVALADTRLRAPVPVPRQMRDCMAFERHVLQAGAATRRRRGGRFASLLKLFGVGVPADVWYRQPVYYKQNRFSVIGHDGETIWPSYSQRMDFECELGFFIGKTGKNIPRETAREHIFGYTIFNDMSARDTQALEMPGRLGPAKSKDFDTGNVIGPWIATADEIPDPYNLAMIARVNGVEWGRGNSGEIHHRLEDIIAHVSREETLYAGEFLATGTVGNGCGLEQDRFLQNNDVVELEIEKIGVLRNQLVRRV